MKTSQGLNIWDNPLKMSKIAMGRMGNIPGRKKCYDQREGGGEFKYLAEGPNVSKVVLERKLD